MKKRFLILSIILSLSMIFSACGTATTADSQTAEYSTSEAQSQTSEKNETPLTVSSAEGLNKGARMNGNDSNGSISTIKQADTELQEMINSVADKFQQGEYTDTASGLTIPYNIYLPENYDSTRKYPMVVFIGDMTTVGTDMEYPLTQGWGGLIWASEEVQSSTECIVLVPVYPETILDDHDGYTTTEYVDITPNMIASVAGQYNVDTERIYGTGQSMGAMTTLILAARNPDLYASILIVDGQWNVSELKGLESQNMIYIAAGGDESAANGQNEVKDMLTQDGIEYSEISELDAQADRNELNDSVQEMLDEGNNINFITWKAGTVMQGVSEGITMEHMASFDYGYKLSSVLKWILSK